MLLAKSQRDDRAYQRQGTEEHLPASNCSVALVFRGSLVADAMVQSLRELSARYPWLRRHSAAGTLVQFADLTYLGAAERTSYEQRCQGRDLEMPFDADNGPLLRATLLRLAADVHALTLTSDCSICEPASLGELVKDLGLAYTARLRRETPDLLPLPTPGAVPRPAARDEDGLPHGRQRGAAVADGGGPPALLPTDRPRERSRRRMASVGFSISGSLCSKAKQIAAECNADEMSAYLAAYLLLVGRFTRSSEVVVALNKSEVAAATLCTLLGSSGEVASVAVPLDRDGSGQQLITAVQRVIEGALSGESGTLEPGDRSAREATLRPSVGFRFGTLLDSKLVEFAGLSVELRPVRRMPGGGEAVLTLLQGPQGIEADWDFDESMFDAETIRGWAGCYMTLLRSLTEESWSPAALLELTTEEQRHSLSSWNSMQTVAAAPGSLHGLISIQALRVPGQLALRAGTDRLSYRELEAASSAFARALQGRGACRGGRVGVLLEPGIDLVVAQLGILKTGAACVPLDPALSSVATRQITKLAALDLLVSRSSLMGPQRPAAVPVLLLDQEAEELELRHRSEERLVSGQGDAPPHADLVDASGEEPAFVICTDQSATVPRLAILPHRALVNCLHGLASRPGLDGSDRLVAFADAGNLCFSLDLLAALAVGAQAIIAGPDARADCRLLQTLLDAESVTVMQAGIGTWRGLIEEGWQHTRTFKALVAADQLDRPLAAELLRRASELWCFYGPPEATGWATSARIQDSDLLPVPGSDRLARRLIGKPANHCTVWVVDEHGEVCPLGVPGEIRIGGGCLALAYLDQRPLTAHCFVPDLLGARAGGKLFRTGDCGRWRHDGMLEHLGSLDALTDLHASPAPAHAASPARPWSEPRYRLPVQSGQAKERAVDAGQRGHGIRHGAGHGDSRVEGMVDLPLYAIDFETGGAAMSATESQDQDGEQSGRGSTGEQADDMFVPRWKARVAAPGSKRAGPSQATALALLAAVLLGAGLSWFARQQDPKGPGLPVEAPAYSAAPAPAAAPNPAVAVMPRVTAPVPREGEPAVDAGAASSIAPAVEKEAVAPAPPKEAVAPAPPKEAVAPAPPKEAVAPAPPKEAVVPAPPKEAVAPAPPKEAIAPAPPKEAVAPAPPKEAIAPAPPKEAIAPAPPKEAVAPAPPKEAIAPAPPKEAVASAPPKEAIAPAPPKEAVAPAPPKEAVAPAPPKEAVASSPPKEANVPVPVKGAVAPAQARPGATTTTVTARAGAREPNQARPATRPVQGVVPPAAPDAMLPASVQPPSDAVAECRMELQVLGLCKKAQ